MSEIRITNCHIHSFTTAHVPRRFPHALLLPFKRFPVALRAVAVLLRLLGQERLADALRRMIRFQVEVAMGGQAELIAHAQNQYPEGTRFVVLPMQMAAMGFGAPAVAIGAQHEELAQVAAQSRGTVIPFAGCDPRVAGAADEVRRAVENLGFRGLKLYPRLGFAPDHPVLMHDVYPLLAARGLPVVSHCSRGGVTGRGLSGAVADTYSSPEAFVPVLRAFPDLRVNLAHFGGQLDWQAYLDDGVPKGARRNWLLQIRDMMRSGDYPNLWSDISYTLFQTDEFLPVLRMFLRDQTVAQRVLFGSDFYMTRQEALSERAVCLQLRVGLGEEMFRQIAETNPEVWLGERQLRDGA